jgi:hypothetical protein
MNGAEAPENRLRVLHRALLYFSGVGMPETKVHLAVTRPLRVNPPTQSRRWRSALIGQIALVVSIVAT